MFPKDATNQKNLARANAFDPLPFAGSVMDKTKNLIRAVWDFTIQGGAVSTLLLLDDQGNPAVLPQGCVVSNVVIHTITGVTSGGAGTISLGLLSTVDLLAATAVTGLTAGSFVAGIPVGTAATWKGPVTAVNGTNLTLSIATAALTAGRIYIFVEYVQSSLT